MGTLKSPGYLLHNPWNPWGGPAAEWERTADVRPVSYLGEVWAGRSWKVSQLLWEGLCPAEQRRGRVLGTAYRMVAENREGHGAL